MTSLLPPLPHPMCVGRLSTDADRERVVNAMSAAVGREARGSRERGEDAGVALVRAAQGALEAVDGAVAVADDAELAEGADDEARFEAGDSGNREQ